MKAIRVGTITNVYDRSDRVSPDKGLTSVAIRWPSRLNAMAIDPGRIDIRDDSRYSAGEVVFAVDLCMTVSVQRLATPSADVVIARRPVLVRHAILLMRHALGITDRLRVTVDNEAELRHVGLGSSSRIIAAVCAAINELYGRPFSNADLLRYCAQNHVEEIDGDDDTAMPVQCLGGSGSAGFYEGSVLVVAGENTVVAAGTVDSDYHVIIGIPSDYVEKDARVLMEAELEMLPQFIATGETYGPTIAYNVLHDMLPAIVRGHLRPIGQVIYDYRFEMGSIKNCSFVYDGLVQLADSLRPLFTSGLADVLALSSVGPGFFVITKQPDVCADAMEAAGLSIIRTRLFAGSYQVLEAS
jgi:beta-ribofuranosylaminobenzene 5'-phosphate synthase